MSKEGLVERIDAELAELMPRFFANARNDVKALRTALTASEFEEVARLGHSIKGSGLGFGLAGLADLGLRIENIASRETDKERLGRLIDELESYLDHVTIEYFEY